MGMESSKAIFELSGNTKEVELFGEKRTLYQIKAITDIDLGAGEIVHVGELGGYIESIDNVPNKDFWIDKDSFVYGDSYLSGYEPLREHPYDERMTPAIKDCTVVDSNIIYSGYELMQIKSSCLVHSDIRNLDHEINIENSQINYLENFCS